jgi:hypothetical protein
MIELRKAMQFAAMAHRNGPPVSVQPLVKSGAGVRTR